MEFSQAAILNPPTFCAYCLNFGTNRCGRCHNVCYCCREHQIAHWSEHKKICKKPIAINEPSATVPNMPSYGTDNFSSFNTWNQHNRPISDNSVIPITGLPEATIGPSNAFAASAHLPVVEKLLDFQLPSEDEIFSSLNSELLLSSDNNFWDVINASDAQNLFDYSASSDEKAIAKIYASLQESASNFANPCLSSELTLNLMQGASLQDICSNVVHDLNIHGICVLDKFVGSELGNSILAEVKNLYQQGIFRKGELVNPSPFLSKESIRSDVTTWVNGREPECANIGSLIKKLDVVLTTCSKLPNNGLLSTYKLHRRTKAMIACYPGDGTYYKKHVDNPCQDGRCITCIYYLNQNWDVKKHGGLLQMFPSSHESQVAKIEPIFDRILFFWSDKRNPHEVLPSYATRFAITVWYFDADERDRALGMYKNRAMMKRTDQQFM